MSVQFFQVDAFTIQPFKGNPAAVCLLNEPKEDEWLQQVAREMNVSETAFLIKREEGYSLRWFTPVAEVDLCGHATLASAHTLWENGFLNEEKEARFITKSGLLTAKQTSNNWIELNFPAEPVMETVAPPGLLEGLGLGEVKFVGKNRMDYLVEAETEEEVKSLRPNWTLLEELGGRGIIVTSQSLGNSYDFISRAFFPAIGINEDPVTGSAHCGLGPYWETQLNKSNFYAYQASQRGGNLKVHVRDDRVLLSGQAVTVMKGDVIA